MAAGVAQSFPPAPVAGDGPLAPQVTEAIELMIGLAQLGFEPSLAAQLADPNDARVLWLIADWLLFTQGGPVGGALLDAAETTAGVEFDESRPWNDLTNHLLAWDLPAPPDYATYKAGLYTSIDPRWAFVFADPAATLDYRQVAWGGVAIDDRELGDPDPCTLGCIPALDDPALTDVDGGNWYPDEGVVFGVVIEGDAVAFPKNIMEVHEMVNTTIGGRRVAMPYCTLCGSAQVFFTDEVPGVARPPVLRTSGLLRRSNKVMYDLDSQSVFDTFTGAAVTGPLREAAVVLPEATVVTTRWSDWKAAHPDTLIVAQDGGIGRSYEADPLAGRDDDGPIFPIGDHDPRLGVHEQVVGVDAVDEQPPVAFPAEAARATLQRGDPVTLGSVTLVLDGGGLRAEVDGAAVPSHQAFWFAWSQFHPDTMLWLP